MEAGIKPIIREAEIEENQQNEPNEENEENKEFRLTKDIKPEAHKPAEDNQKPEKNLETSKSPFAKKDPQKETESLLAKQNGPNSPTKLSQSPIKSSRSFRKFRFNTKLSAAPNKKIKRAGQNGVERKQPRSTTDFNPLKNNNNNQKFVERRPQRAVSFSKLERVKETEEQRSKKNKQNKQQKLMQKKKSGFAIQPRRLF